MNYKVLIFVLAVVLLQVTESCKKDSLPDGRFIGTWVSEDKTDTLYFINDNTFKMPHYDRILHTYTYTYDKDSITIQYAGPNMILLPPSTHHYTLSHSTFTIDKYKLNDQSQPVGLVLQRQ